MTVIDRALDLLDADALYITVETPTQIDGAHLVVLDHDVADARLQLHAYLTGDEWSCWNPDDTFEDHMDTASGAQQLAALITSWATERLNETPEAV